MKMFSPEIETLDRKTLRELQLERLKHTVRYAYENVPMYRRRFDEIGLKPEHIQTLKDIELIPYTTKDDLRDNYPFGLFAVPMKKIVRLHASSGTTGKPVVGGYTRADLDNWSTCIARILTMAGATDEDIFHVAFGYGLFTGGFGLHYGVEKLGATVVPVSSGNTDRQIMLLKDFGATALIATPSYAMYLAETARQKGVLDDLKLRLVCMGAEASTAEMQVEVRGETEAINNCMFDEALARVNGAAAMYGCKAESEVMGEAIDFVRDDEVQNNFAEAAEHAQYCTKISPTMNFNGSDDATVLMRRVQNKGGKAGYVVVGSELKAGHHQAAFDFEEFRLKELFDIYHYLAIKHLGEE